jgi:branched-chain amino acid transport system permease protein
VTVAVEIIFQSLAYASVLFLLSIGLAVTLGLMGFINLAHGVFAMAGAYLAATAMRQFGAPWLVAVIGAALAAAVLAAVAERLLYARLYGASDLDQVLFSIGLIFVAGAIAKILFGPLVTQLPPPLTGTVRLGGLVFDSFKLVIIATGAATALAVRLSLEHTRLGAMVRAAVENRGMAQSVGLRTERIFTLTFALGGLLAAVGAIMGSGLFSLTPNYALDILITMQIIVAIAGLGTLRGVYIASLGVGLLQVLSGYFAPASGTILLFTAVFLLLLLRPRGLYGRI